MPRPRPDLPTVELCLRLEHIGSSQPKRSAPSEAFKVRSFFDCGSRWISRRVRRGVSRHHFICLGAGTKKPGRVAARTGLKDFSHDGNNPIWFQSQCL